MIRLGIEAVRPKIRMTEAEKAGLRERARSNLSATRIAAETGIPFFTVADHLRTAGIPVVHEKVLKARDRERLKQKAWIEAERDDGVENP